MGGLLERGEGGLFTKSNDYSIYERFSILLPHILRIQHAILPVKYINSTHSFIPNDIKNKMQGCLAK